MTPPENEPLGDERDQAAGHASADLADALGGGVSAPVGDPSGSLGGAGRSIASERAALVAMERLSGRERERAGAALHLVRRDARHREERGERVRDDDFFDERGTLRPAAEELLEGVLRHAAETYEERKLPYLAWLYSSVAHDPTVPAADVLYLTRVAASLTYRQLVALAVIAHRDEHFRALARVARLRDEGRAVPDATVVLELDDLGDRRLVGVRSGGRVASVGQTYGSMPPISGAADGYGALALLPAGETLVRLARVNTINVEERQTWIEALTGETDDA